LTPAAGGTLEPPPEPGSKNGPRTKIHQSEVYTLSGDGRDVVLSVLAGAVCASLRRRLTGYHDATPDTLQRRFLSTTGAVLNHGDTITVRLNRRTYSPVLRQADIPDTTVPWWGDRRLHFEYD